MVCVVEAILLSCASYSIIHSMRSKECPNCPFLHTATTKATLDVLKEAGDIKWRGDSAVMRLGFGMSISPTKAIVKDPKAVSDWYPCKIDGCARNVRASLSDFSRWDDEHREATVVYEIRETCMDKDTQPSPEEHLRALTRKASQNFKNRKR